MGTSNLIEVWNERMAQVTREAAHYAALPNPGIFSAVDIDGDGWLPYLSTSNNQFIAASDLNHDGLLDIVTNGFYSLNVAGNYYTVHFSIRMCTVGLLKTPL